MSLVDEKYAQNFVTEDPVEQKNEDVVDQEVEPTEQPSDDVVEQEDEPAEQPSEKVVNEVQQVESDVVEVLDDVVEYEPNDDDLINALKSRGLNIDNLEQLKSPAISEELLQVQRFMDATGKGARDYYNLFRDYDAMDEDKLIQLYHKEKGTSPKMLKLKMKDLTLKENDPDYPDEEISEYNERVEALREQELIEAKAFFNKQKEDFKLPEQPTEQEMQKQREQQILATNQLAERVSTNLRPFEFTVGQKKFRMTHGADTKKLVQDFVKEPNKYFVEPFVGDKGFKSADAELEYYENALWFHKPTREKMLAVISKQVKDATIESTSKKKRNVTLDDVASSDSNHNGENRGVAYWDKVRMR